MTHHTCAVPTRVTRRDPSSVRVVVPVYATPWHINAHSLHSVPNLVDTGTLNYQVYLGRLDSSYWVEEQLGLNMGCCKVPSRSERGPPAEATKHGQCRRRVRKRTSQQTYHAWAHVTGILGWPPLGAVLMTDTRMNTTCRKRGLSAFSHVWSIAGVRWSAKTSRTMMTAFVVFFPLPHLYTSGSSLQVQSPLMCSPMKGREGDGIPSSPPKWW